MIEVTIKLVSAVSKSRDRELGRMVICNDGTSQRYDRGDYAVSLGRRGEPTSQQVLKAPLRKGEVKNYPRLSYSVWVLVARALKSVGIEKWAEFKEEPVVPQMLDAARLQGLMKCHEPYGSVPIFQLQQLLEDGPPIDEEKEYESF